MKRAVLLPVLLALQTSAAPPIPPAPTWVAPAIEARPLASGARLWVLPRQGMPLVHVGVMVAAGSMEDPKGKPGLAALTATAIEEGGAGSKSGPQVRAFFDSLGTSLVFHAGEDAIQVGFSVLSTRLEPALAQLVEVISTPRFDAGPVAAVKMRRRSEIISDMDDPLNVAAERLSAALFEGGPRGHLPNGTVAGLDAIAFDDITRFHTAHWSPSAVTFILVGDVQADAAKQLFDRFAPKPWFPGAKRTPTPALELRAPKARWLGVDKPGAAQTIVFMGRHGPAALDAKVTPLELVATALGGSFTSRLVQNLREKNGYTYGVRAAVQPGREVKALTISTRVKTEVTAPAMAELVKELKGITTITAAEVAKARALEDAALVESFALGPRLVGVLTAEAMQGAGPNSLQKRQAERAAVTLAMAQAAAAQFSPDEFTVVLVGDRAQIDKPLRDLFPLRAIEWQPPSILK